MSAALPALPALRNTTAVAVGTAIAGLGYAAIVERNAFVVRELTMPVLTPGSSPLRVLHLSDIHMRPTQRHKQSWLRELARWEPDLVPSISRAAASGSSSSSVSAAGFDQDDHVEQVGGSEALAPHVRMTVGPSAS